MTKQSEKTAEALGITRKGALDLYADEAISSVATQARIYKIALEETIALINLIGVDVLPRAHHALLTKAATADKETSLAMQLAALEMEKHQRLKRPKPKR